MVPYHQWTFERSGDGDERVEREVSVMYVLNGHNGGGSDGDERVMTHHDEDSLAWFWPS